MIDSLDSKEKVMCNYISRSRLCKLFNDLKKASKIKIYEGLITFVEDRVEHDRRFTIHSTKSETEFVWKTNKDFNSEVVKTVEWYLEHR